MAKALKKKAAVKANVRFYYEENHCVENLTEIALDRLKAAKEKAEADMRKENPGMPEQTGLCVTCHGATVTLLGIRDVL
jgi:cytochrome c553